MRLKFCKELARERPGAEFRNDRPAERRIVSVPVRICGVVLLAVMTSACASTFEQVGSLYVSPGKYILLKCPDLAAKSNAASTREKELVSLMDRANQDMAGPVINTLIYKTDLDTVRADLAEIKKTEKAKNCSEMVAAAKPPPTASVPPHSDPSPAR
jgi:hypothetical protein